MFTCHVDTEGIDLVTFQWVRTDGENVSFFNQNIDMEVSGSGSGAHPSAKQSQSSRTPVADHFNSTLNIVNVNYTDNSVGYYCNASGCNVSMIAYLTGKRVS